MDGRAASLFKKPDEPYRDYVYGEMERHALSNKRMEPDHTSIPQGDPRPQRAYYKTATGLSGGISRAGYAHKNAFDTDQLYNFLQDPKERAISPMTPNTPLSSERKPLRAPAVPRASLRRIHPRRQHSRTSRSRTHAQSPEGILRLSPKGKRRQKAKSKR